MNNLVTFPNLNPSRDHGDSDDSPDAKTLDPRELQRLVEQLAATVSPQTSPRGAEREIRIRNFRSDRWSLAEDMYVSLEERGGQYIATSYDTGQYGHGYSPDAAIFDLCSVLEQYYDLLAEDEGHLSAPLQAHLRYLRSALRERK